MLVEWPMCKTATCRVECELLNCKSTFFSIFRVSDNTNNIFSWVDFFPNNGLSLHIWKGDNALGFASFALSPFHIWRLRPLLGNKSTHSHIICVIRYSNKQKKNYYGIKYLPVYPMLGIVLFGPLTEHKKNWLLPTIQHFIIAKTKTQTCIECLIT